MACSRPWQTTAPTSRRWPTSGARSPRGSARHWRRGTRPAWSRVRGAYRTGDRPHRAARTRREDRPRPPGTAVPVAPRPEDASRVAPRRATRGLDVDQERERAVGHEPGRSRISRPWTVGARTSPASGPACARWPGGVARAPGGGVARVCRRAPTPGAARAYFARSMKRASLAPEPRASSASVSAVMG